MAAGPAVALAMILILAQPVFIPHAGAIEGMGEYTIPLTITNNGGSTAPSFTVTVYLDGEKIAGKAIDGGIPAHSSVPVAIPVFTTPGTHALKIVVDEGAAIRDSNRDNNILQGTYDFPA